MSDLAPTVQAWFAERLMSQRQASPRTIAAYRDTFRMLLGFAQARTGKAPCRLGISDIDAKLVGAFLAHLEQGRGNSARTRNTRLAAMSPPFFAYAVLWPAGHNTDHLEQD